MARRRREFASFLRPLCGHRAYVSHPCQHQMGKFRALWAPSPDAVAFWQRGDENLIYRRATRQGNAFRRQFWVWFDGNREHAKPRAGP